MSRSRCPIPGCERPVGASTVLCGVHWQAVPGRLRGRMQRRLRALVDAECRTDDHSDPAVRAAEAAHDAAVRAAIESVAPR